jgi:hypothetical protein
MDLGQAAARYYFYPKRHQKGAIKNWMGDCGLPQVEAESAKTSLFISPPSRSSRPHEKRFEDLECRIQREKLPLQSI